MNEGGVSRTPRLGGALPLASRDSGASDETMLEGLRGWLRGLKRPKPQETLRDALEDLIEQREESEQPIDEHERSLLGNILRLRGQTAYDVMVPRADISAIEIGASLQEIIEFVQKTGHSRYPVYRESLDDAVGLVHIKDVLLQQASGKPFQLPRIVRRVLFVSPSIRVLDLADDLLDQILDGD